MITEVKTDEAPNCCPFMSGQPVPITPPPGHVLQPNQMTLASIAVPCAKEKCAVWDSVLNMCSVLSVANNADDIRTLLGSIRSELSNLRMVFTPAQDSPSPLMRIAESLETLVKLEKTTVSLKVDHATDKEKG